MREKKVKLPQCAECRIERKICNQQDGHGPASCPTINSTDLVEASISLYERPEIKKFALQATVQEGECYVNRDNPKARYAIKPRVQETVEFAHKMGYKRLGIAFCGGLRDEAAILSKILKEQGFEVASVVCKVGRTPKELLGAKEEQKVNPGEFESMCSPITQAKILNAAETEFNILFGLCVGHDSLVMRYSDAPCTALVAKDRVTGHNPLAAILLHNSYYRKLKTEEFNKGGPVTVSVTENL